MQIYKFELKDKEKCSLCEIDKWIGFSGNITKYFLITGSHRDSSLIFIDYKKNRYLIGVKYKDTSICLTCFELLVGMEDFFDDFYTRLINKKLVKKLILAIITDEKLRNKAFEYREKGKYFPGEFIKNIVRFAKIAE